MADIIGLLKEQIVDCLSSQKKLAIVGHNSKQFMGRAEVGEPLHMAGHSGVVNYNPAELVITVRAGTSLTYLQHVLQEKKQMLPFEPPVYGGQGTIGGAVACNSAGSARPWKGAVRDSILGVKIINGRAQVLSFGGQVMKNVAGYDIARLQTGAMGTLGVLAEVSLRTLPLPEATITLSQAASADEAITIMNKAASTAMPLTGACWYQGQVYLRLSGFKSAVENIALKWHGQSTKNHKIWRTVDNHQLVNMVNAKEIWQFSLTETTPHFLESEDWLIDWSGARRYLVVPADSAQVNVGQLEEYVKKYSGKVFKLKGSSQSDEYFPALAEPLQKIHRHLKSTFDPERIFNVGRMYSWL